MKSAGVALLAAVAVTGCGAHATSPSPHPPLQLDAAVAAGFDRAKLAAADRRFQTLPLLSVIVLRHRRVVFERYYHEGSRPAKGNVFSVTKSVVSALVGIALRDGRLRSVDQKVASFFADKLAPDADPRVRSITLRQLLTMTAGYREHYIAASDDWVRTSLNRQLASDPGAEFSYDSPSAHLVGAIVAKATGLSLATFAQRALFTPLGIRPGGWTTDGQRHELGSTGLRLRALDLVKLGQLYLQHGRWRGRQLVPAHWVRESTSRQASVPGGLAYGYLWWLNTGPHGGFLAIGHAGQMIAVLPRLDMVVVTTASDEFDRTAVLKLLLRAAGR